MTLDSTILELYKTASKPNYNSISNKLVLVEGTTSTAVGLTSIMIGLEEPNTLLGCIGTLYAGYGTYLLFKSKEKDSNTQNPLLYKPFRPALLAASSIAIISAVILEKIILDNSDLLPAWTYTTPLLFASFAANIFAATSRTYLQELQEKDTPIK